MNLHLTRDEADRLDADGRVVLFRDGDISTADATYGVVLPPAEFVEAAKPCECPCHGSGMNPAEVDTYCPDCVDGKRRIAAVVPCDRCGGWGKNIGTRYAPHPPTGDCPDCDEGRVTVATVVVEWGPAQVTDEWAAQNIPPWELRHDLVGQYALGVTSVSPPVRQ